MTDLESLFTRYFPQLKPSSTWISLAQYWTQKNDTLVAANLSFELLYSYLLFSLTDNGFVLVIEEEEYLPTLRTTFQELNELVWLSIHDSAEEQKKAISNIENNTAKVVITSVQRFCQKGNKFLEYLKSYQVQQIAIHNAYKLSLWGSFEERYSPLHQFKTYLKHVPIIAVSPLLPRALEKDLKTILKLREPASIYLTHLPKDTYFTVIEPYTDIQSIIQNIADKHISEKGILISENYPHALPDNISIQAEKADFIIYLTLPPNLEQLYFTQQYYQSKAFYLIYDKNKVNDQKKAIVSIYTSKLHSEIAQKRFDEVITFCQSNSCKRQYLQKYWQIPLTEPCKKCNICLNEPNTSILQDNLPQIQQLNEILIQKRLALAKARNLLAHQVFSDKTIIELASYLPQNHDDLTYITGLGKKKIEIYGDNILDNILDFCASHNLSTRIEELKKQRKQEYSIDYPNLSVSVVKKAKIRTLVQEIGYWDSQMICEALGDEDISISEVESVLQELRKSK